MEYRLDFSDDAKRQLGDLTARERVILLAAIRQQLSYEPGVSTKNRKELKENLLAAWELRVGGFRVFYDVVSEPMAAVMIRAIGVKKGEELWIEKERYRL